MPKAILEIVIEAEIKLNFALFYPQHKQKWRSLEKAYSKKEWDNVVYIPLRLNKTHLANLGMYSVI